MGDLAFLPPPLPSFLPFPPFPPPTRVCPALSLHLAHTVLGSRAQGLSQDFRIELRPEGGGEVLTTGSDGNPQKGLGTGGRGGHPRCRENSMAAQWGCRGERWELEPDRCAVPAPTVGHGEELTLQSEQVRLNRRCLDL